MKRQISGGSSELRKLSFLRLVEEDHDLASLRQKYRSKSSKERRMAADWHYHSATSFEMFKTVLAHTGGKESWLPHWPSGVVALTIDPFYAPALLTVGSIEYQFGRTEEAMILFMKLTSLPKKEKDLPEIIDKAGDFLLDHKDYGNALKLYLAAERLDPGETIYKIGSGYCLGKLGRHKESVEKHRQAVAREPKNYKHLNDLGYSLLEAGEYEEAEKILRRSQKLAPSDYEFPKNNLEELYERKRIIGEN